MFWEFFRQKSCPFLLILWISFFCYKVTGVSIDSAIARKARCYANCLTEKPAANHTATNSETSNYKECFIPCGTPFSDEETCKQICNNASSCEESCVFLAQLQKFSSILAGDGSLAPRPGIPVVTSKNFTSISLKWDPVLKASGAVVYLVEMTFTGEQSRFSPEYLSEVYISPQATVKFENPCAYTAQAPSRSEYTDIFFKFKIAVLTENSSLSYGSQSSQITLTKPDFVTNVTLVSLLYDSASPVDKLKLTVSWNPPEDQKDIISHYGALFYADASCQYNSLPRSAVSNGVEATLSIHIFHESLKCIHRVEIYSIVGCSVSDPTLFNYTYPGCQNITNFPASECYKFDPPYAPLEDIMVSNVKLEGNMTEQKDNHFTATVTWKPPVYPHKKPMSYLMKWFREDSPGSTESQFVGLSSSVVNRNTIKNLLPGTFYKVRIRPKFPDGIPLSEWVSIFLMTPGCLEMIDFPESECDKSHSLDSPLENAMVSNVTIERPITAQHDYRFTVTVTWKGPVYQNITPSMYVVKWSKDSLSISPSNVFRQTIINLLPGTSYKLEIRPVFPEGKPLANWTSVIIDTPGVDPAQVKVRCLTSGQFSPSADGGSFSVKISWEQPTFNYSKLVSYNISYLTGSKDATNVELPPSLLHFVISGILQGERVGYWVIPNYKDVWIEGIAVPGNATAPDKEPPTDPLSAVELGVLVVGILLAVLIVICVSFRCFRGRQRQRKAERGSGKKASIIDQWEVDADLVTLKEELGEGAFGKVYKGILKELTTPSQKRSMMSPINEIRKNTAKQTGGFTVAVKMLHGMADGDQRREFLQEIQLMKTVGSHKNIVNMLGCCTLQEPMFLLVEYIPYGDLLHYLRKRRRKVKQNDDKYVNSEAREVNNMNIQILSLTAHSSETAEETGIHNKGMIKENEANDEKDESEETLSPEDLMAFAWQICQGMEYLTGKGFVHRDLAARNVLVGENKIAKVADFGLTRHVYEEEVYHAKSSRKLPLKWMSIEAIFDQTFTTQSDVWAFGVLLWELVTLGGTPYPTINNRELLRLLKRGYRMEKPDICNDEMFSMMTDCWMENPDDRPNFTQIRERLEEMMQKDKPYLDFSVLDESRDYYNVPSFNSLNGKSADDDLFDKENDEVSKNENASNSLGEGKSLRERHSSYKYEKSPMSNRIQDQDMDQGIGPDNVNKIDFNNSVFSDEDSRNLKDVKLNIEAIEMA